MHACIQCVPSFCLLPLFPFCLLFPHSTPSLLFMSPRLSIRTQLGGAVAARVLREWTTSATLFPCHSIFLRVSLPLCLSALLSFPSLLVLGRAASSMLDSFALVFLSWLCLSPFVRFERKSNDACVALTHYSLSSHTHSLTHRTHMHTHSHSLRRS